MALEARALADGGCVAARRMAAEVAALLASRADMLAEYFSITFRGSAVSGEQNEAGVGGDNCDNDDDVVVAGTILPSSAPQSASSDDVVMTAPSDTAPPRKRARCTSSPLVLTHLPRLLDGHVPSLALTPDFLLTLAYDVDWTVEKPCFHGVAQALAAFYARLPPLPSADTADADVELSRSLPTSPYWIAERVVWPALKATLLPPMRLARDHHVVQIAATEQLYRIFERC